MFEFRYTLNDDDYLAFNLFNLFNHPKNKQGMKLFRWVHPPMMFLFLIVFIIPVEFFLDYFIIFISLTCVVLWMIFFKTIIASTLKKNTYKLKNEHKFLYDQNVFLQFSENDFYESCDTTQTRTKYLRIENILVSKSAVYLYVAPALSYIIPNKAFINEQQRTDFIHFIEFKSHKTAINCK